MSIGQTGNGDDQSESNPWHWGNGEERWSRGNVAGATGATEQQQSMVPVAIDCVVVVVGRPWAPTRSAFISCVIFQKIRESVSERQKEVRRND
jgi:hypothetical protein